MHNRFRGPAKQIRQRSSADAAGRKQSNAQASLRQDHQVCLFGPERYEARYKYPLIIWLHSCGSSELELESIMPSLSMQNYVACAPRGTSACDPMGRLFSWNQTSAGCAIAEEIVFESIELAASQFSINTRKIFIAGFGGGGTMAWRIGLRYPERFAGIVNVCGQFPHSQQSLTNLFSARRVPSLWMYGAESEECGIDEVCKTLPILHAAGLRVDVRQYPCGTELLENMLEDINRWMMGLVTEQPCRTQLESPATIFSDN